MYESERSQMGVRYCQPCINSVSKMCQLYNNIHSSRSSLPADESVLLEKWSFTARICNVRKEVKSPRGNIVFSIWNRKIYFRNIKNVFQLNFCTEKDSSFGLVKNVDLSQLKNVATDGLAYHCPLHIWRTVTKKSQGRTSQIKECYLWYQI